MKVDHLKLLNPETIGSDIEAWFNSKAAKGEPVQTIVSVTYYLTAQVANAGKTIQMPGTQGPPPEYVFNFVIIYT